MLSRLCLVTLVALVVAMTSCASAKHLKVHVHQQQKPRPHGKFLGLFGADDRPDPEGPQYLKDNFDEIYGVCNFMHEGMEMKWFSVGFFGQDGTLLQKFCSEKYETSFDDIKALSNNANDWESYRIDAQSVCYLHKSEEKGAEPLMTSYDCKSWYEFWK